MRKSSRPARVVCIGGGTGLPMVLRGLAERVGGPAAHSALQVTAVVAPSDDGGSSGRLRRDFAVLPPGDIRNCLVALAGEETDLSRAFQYRFPGGRGLRGHALGNLFLTALAEQRGNFLDAVRISAELLGSRGSVLPSTLEPVILKAERADGRWVIGERHLARGSGPVRRVELEPKSPRPAPGLIEALAAADLVVLGPGSLFSSVLPNLLVAGVASGLRRGRAPRVMVMNLMSEPGETDGMDGVAHLKAVLDHAGAVVDAVLLNARPPQRSLLARYRRQGARPVECDLEEMRRLGVAALRADLLAAGPRVRHDPRKVAAALLALALAPSRVSVSRRQAQPSQRERTP